MPINQVGVSWRSIKCNGNNFTEWIGTSGCWLHQYSMHSLAKKQEWPYRTGKKEQQRHFFGVKYEEFIEE